MKQSILINLNRCTGCWTCSLACKVGNDLPKDVWWQHVRTIGAGTGIDDPSGAYPALEMSWMPVHTKKCMLCAERTADGLEPFCTYNCPTKAMTFGDLDDAESPITIRMNELKELGFHFSQLPTWEGMNSDIYYASK